MQRNLPTAMFPMRRYQRVSQHADSEDEEEEEVVLYAHSKLMGESEFGSGEYDQGMDLSLPRIKALKPSHRRPHSWIHSLLAVCLFVVFLSIVLAIAIAAIVIGQQWSNFEEDNWESSSCLQPPPPTLFPIPPPSTPVAVLPPSPSPVPPSASGSPSTLGSEPPSLSNTSETSLLSSGEPRSNVMSQPSTPPPPRVPTSEPASKAPSPSELLTVTETTSPSVPLTDTETPSPSELHVLTVTETPSPSELLTVIETPSPSVPLTDTETPSPSVPLTDTETPSPSVPLTDTETPSPSVPLIDTEMSPTSGPSMDTETSKPLTSISPTNVPLSSPSSPTKSNTPTSSPAPSFPSPPPTFSSPNTTITWERSLFPAATESTVQLYDMNSDGIVDVLVVNGYSQCAVRIMALDGLNGSTVWETEVDFEVFAVRCELDVDSDGNMDCLAMGRYSGYVSLSGLDGSMLWVVDPSVSFPRYNFYFPLVVPDLDGDGVDDLINMHGGDSTYKSSETKRSPAFLITISGKTGQKLMDRVLVPDGHESYMSPVLFSFADGTQVILFGTGGETLPGSLWAVTLSSIQASVQEYTNSSKYADYQVLRNYTNYPCSAEMSYDEIEALRPVFDPTAYNLNLTDPDYPPFTFCPRWGDLHPIWNMYGLCIYELVHAEHKGVILPPVIVDMTGDGFDDLVVSTFDGHTMVLDGRDASVVWELFLPGTETYSLPAPLFFNEDATPDLLVRVNEGKYMTYNYSYVAILDGRDGRELWALNSTLTGMMSGLTLASDTHGWDAAVFLSVGSDPNDGSDYPWESNSAVSDSSGMEQKPNVSETDLELGSNSFSNTGHADGDQKPETMAGTGEGGKTLSQPEGTTEFRAPRHSSKQECTRVYFEGPGSKVCPWYEWLVDSEGVAVIREKRHGDGDDDDDDDDDDEGEEGSGEGRDVVDYSHDFIQNSLKVQDPPGLWVSTETDPFPDPTTDLDAFLRYCGYSREHLTALLYLVTREMLDGEENIIPLATHDPFVYLPPRTPPDEYLPPPLALPTSPAEQPSTSEAPPTTSEAPPTTSKVPPTTSEAPPTTSKVPPTTSEAPPTTSKVPPTTSEAPPTTSEAPPTTSKVPPTTSEAPPTRSKRHGPGMHTSDSGGWEPVSKHTRCRHIEAPTLIPSTPAIGDLNGDGRLEIAYVILWGSMNGESFNLPPKLLIRTLTLEDRFVEVYGKGVVDFSRFLPLVQQPWTRYMGTRGNNVFRVPRHRGHM